MKQFITVEQLNELSKKGKEKLREWWKPKWSDIIFNELNPENGVYQMISQYIAKKTKMAKEMGCLPILSIGQMIEFLDEYLDNNYPDSAWRIERVSFWMIEIDNVLGKFPPKFFKDELCDSLWNIVKEVLETKT